MVALNSEGELDFHQSIGDESKQVELSEKIDYLEAKLRD